MWNRRRSSTRGLTSSELVISDSRRLVRLLTVLLALVLIALVVSISLLSMAKPPEMPISTAVSEAFLQTDSDEVDDAEAEPVSIDDARVASLEEQNAQLQAQVKALQDALNGATLDLEVERATRDELELQINGLREHLVQTQEELAFLKSAGNGATKP